MPPQCHISSTICCVEFWIHSQDEFNDWRGEMYPSMIETEAEVERAMNHQLKLKSMLAAGGIAGPGSIGDPYVEMPEEN